MGIAEYTDYCLTRTQLHSLHTFNSHSLAINFVVAVFCFPDNTFSDHNICSLSNRCTGTHVSDSDDDFCWLLLLLVLD